MRSSGKAAWNRLCIFQIARPQGPLRLLLRKPGTAHRTAADQWGFLLCRGWRADGFVRIPSGDIRLRFGPFAILWSTIRAGILIPCWPSSEPPAAGGRPSWRSRIWPIRLVNRI